jgi:hypothetical protein
MNLGPEDGRLAHLAAKLSLTVRTSLLIREFAKLSGRSIKARVGNILGWQDLAPLRDRKQLIAHLQSAVFALSRDTHTRRHRARIPLRIGRSRTPASR